MKNPKEYKMVLFTGGEDVGPSLYSDTSPKNMCQSNPGRDLYELAVYKKAKANNILMTGICRGLQFLNVMAGGKLIHHMNRHVGTYHDVTLSNGTSIYINSFHHQMIIPPQDTVITAWADPPLSTIYIGKNDEILNTEMTEYEAAIFPKIKAFGVQYHPEMMNKDSFGYLWYHEMVDRSLRMKWEDFIEHYRRKQKDAKQDKVHQSHNNSAG
jgi:gamma-glutamyl-gamma-aminobutyrate hydrolase PuuD